MAINKDYVGRTFPPGEPYEVSRVKIGEFADAIGDRNPLFRDRVAARDWPPFDSAEATVLLSEEHREVLAAVRKLADRQREALTLRYYLGLSTDETARVMGISAGTVKSAISRAIAALGRTFREES